jgi:signal transduction histidine kinase
MLWLLRRKDTVYGWYALSTLLGAAYGWNYVSTNTWPFASTDARQAFIAAVFTGVVASFVVFLLRFSEHRLPRTERALGLFGLVAFVAAFAAPHVMGPWRNLWIVPAVAVYYAAILAFLWHAARTPRIDVRVLGACLLLPLVVSFHDFAVYMEWWRGGNGNLDALTSPLLVIGMGFAVAWRFSLAMRRIEGFNVELKHEVDAATAELAATLEHQHELALAHTRIGERLNLVRDLHDGFGGSLLGTIAALEQSPADPGTAHAVAMLKELRDDLHLVIDTTTHEQDLDLAGLLAPLRRRWSQRLDLAGIGYRWRLDGLDDLHLGSARSLDLLRFLQEALTNVLKHSRAGSVDIRMRREGERLVVEIRDDGHGFDPAAGTHGAGLASLRARGARLGAEFALHAAPAQGVALRLDVPLPPA